MLVGLHRGNVGTSYFQAHAIIDIHVAMGGTASTTAKAIAKLIYLMLLLNRLKMN